MTSSSNNSSLPLNYYDWRRAMGATASAYERYLDQVKNGGPASVERRFTLGEVKDVLNQAANLVADVHDGYESSDTIAQDDAVNLAVNAAGYLLDHPNADLDEIIPACYANVVDIEDDLDEDEEVPERGSQRRNELVTAKVKRWLS
jgi:hypothetical protein